MNIAKFLKKLSGSRIPDHWLLEWYPPFWLAGAKILKVASDYRELHLQLPLKWYGKNHHGTMFGGWICAVSDPLAALLCAKIFPGTQVWTKSQRVDFVRPAKGTIDFVVTISDADIETIDHDLNKRGEATRTFKHQFTDHRKRVVAKVENTVFIRRKAKS